MLNIPNRDMLNNRKGMKLKGIFNLFIHIVLPEKYNYSKLSVVTILTKHTTYKHQQEIYYTYILIHVIYLKIQCFAKFPASLAVQSALGFSFIFSHHPSLPTSGVHAASVNKNTPDNNARILFLNRFIDAPSHLVYRTLAITINRVIIHWKLNLS
jgi:hypothetical protein